MSEWSKYAAGADAVPRGVPGASIGGLGVPPGVEGARTCSGWEAGIVVQEGLTGHCSLAGPGQSACGRQRRHGGKRHRVSPGRVGERGPDRHVQQHFLSGVRRH